MSHVLIERLIEDLGYTEVSLENHDEFVATSGLNVLFFPGDPKTVKDATDVAVVLPELMHVFAGRLNAGVVTDVFGDGKTLKRRYGFSQYPALVFVRSGDYVGTIMRMRDWAEYIGSIKEFLVAPPRRPPGFSIDVVSA
ncbi:MAG: hydrogenase-1 expression HyaE [Gammaproteobacteria bacterium]|nr:hydrogenase-1 expression HyaE [Gammaproteobacteria bacterium]MBT8105847.1 hydrogenase-1 expression HyaE [Gammaproteobacteria bacterium]NNF49752.1 hydrogenase-1 expression HyaE [Woeseiaceae bacterium]NNK25861.1 hydrogenase-1 expression HyaE [Woeseiaceae bacterium]NNL64418.1 hydrogenase-1 expression HyaE [Woeseiaceae bacterium]